MRNQKRKGFEHFRTLTKKQQKHFRKNCHEHGGVYWFNQALNDNDLFFGFIGGNFHWDKTPQGLKYWSRIANKK